jgi:hypothetical protein
MRALGAMIDGPMVALLTIARVCSPEAHRSAAMAGQATDTVAQGTRDIVGQGCSGAKKATVGRHDECRL